MEVPLPCGRQTEGTASQQEELGGDGGVKGEALGDFHFHFHFREKVKVESESHFNFVIIAVFLEFVSVLEKGLRPLVLAINVSKFLPASRCSNRQLGIRS